MKRSKVDFTLEEISIEEWLLHWKKIFKTNILQSLEYGIAKERAEGWKVYRFAIKDASSKPVAITQCLGKSWPIIGGIARMNRGPLLLDQYNEEVATDITIMAIRLLLSTMQKKRCRVIQIAPELHNTELVKERLRNIGLKFVESTPWASGLMDLKKEEQTVLMSINGKWRNSMRKGEKLGVTVEKMALNKNTVDALLNSYKGLQHDRKFEGLSENLIIELALLSNKNWSFNLFFAWDPEDISKQEPIGELVTISHGDTAIYLIGCANDKGRQMQANSVLLWNGITDAQKTGCSWFDIGGLNAATPVGIGEFKKGLNAAAYSLVGEYRAYLLPWKSW